MYQMLLIEGRHHQNILKNIGFIYVQMNIKENIKFERPKSVHVYYCLSQIYWDKISKVNPLMCIYT